MKKSKIFMNLVVVIFCAILVYFGTFILTGEHNKLMSGICLGVGAGLFGGIALPMFITNIMPMINPKLAKIREIEKNDERNISINNASKAKAFDYLGVIVGLAAVITIILEKDWLVVSIFGVCYISMAAIHIFYLHKFSKEL